MIAQEERVNPEIPPRFNEDQLLAGRKVFSAPSSFLLGVASLEQLPAPKKVEIAIAGRSNVGKSSLINALTGVRGLARASNTPGRTRELNFFNIAERLILVDMPGYGYAKAPKTEIRKWQNMLKGYLRGRANLARAFVLIDARHGVLPADEEMMGLLDESAVTYQLVLTKMDKLKPQERIDIVTETEKIAKKRAASFPTIHATSSDRQLGLDELRAEIAGLLEDS